MKFIKKGVEKFAEKMLPTSIVGGILAVTAAGILFAIPGVNVAFGTACLIAGATYGGLAAVSATAKAASVLRNRLFRKDKTRARVNLSKKLQDIQVSIGGNKEDLVAFINNAVQMSTDPQVAQIRLDPKSELSVADQIAKQLDANKFFSKEANKRIENLNIVLGKIIDGFKAEQEQGARTPNVGVYSTPVAQRRTGHTRKTGHVRTRIEPRVTTRRPTGGLGG